MTSIRAILTATALSAFAMPALAADVIESIPTPPVAVDVPFTWTGGYVGFQLGGLDTLEEDGDSIAGLNGDVDIDGFIGGVHAGYDYQFANGLVLGAYVDVDLSSANVDLEGVANDVGELDYVARGMVRAGYGFGRVLGYVQGGYAYTEAEIDGIDEELDSGGYAVGLGAEYAVFENVSVGADYLYHRFNDFDDIGGIDASELDFDVHTVRAKFSYRF